ncbi:BA14K family protein [Ochrobactrum sp. CGA5]|uniref:BA14K family protein n=1 Tax=Ochrobactrum sp. CGA5 TaxID=2583453 RepID=UPI00111F5646|nr:BA14K family protein [Ochrobactrum sp. CGA5]
MKKFACSLFAACLSLGMGLSAAAGAANAAQPSLMATPSAQTTTPNVQNVQYYDYRDRRHWREHRRHWRHHRPYYRYDRRYWGPPPAYRYRSAPVYRGGNPHIRWCYNRYRSYRAYDNTFQPNYGPRRQCYSPYL